MLRNPSRQVCTQPSGQSAPQIVLLCPTRSGIDRHHLCRLTPRPSHNKSRVPADTPTTKRHRRRTRHRGRIGSTERHDRRVELRARRPGRRPVRRRRGLQRQQRVAGVGGDPQAAVVAHVDVVHPAGGGHGGDGLDGRARHGPAAVRHDGDAVDGARRRRGEVQRPAADLHPVEPERVVGAARAGDGLHLGEVERRRDRARGGVHPERDPELAVAHQHRRRPRDGGQAVEARRHGHVGDLARVDLERQRGRAARVRGDARLGPRRCGVPARAQVKLPQRVAAQHAVGRVAAEADVAGHDGEHVRPVGDLGDAVGAVAARHLENWHHVRARGHGVLDGEDVGLGDGHCDEEVSIGAGGDVLEECLVVSRPELEDRAGLKRQARVILVEAGGDGSSGALGGG